MADISRVRLEGGNENKRKRCATGESDYMSVMRISAAGVSAVALALFISATPAAAYIGPGLGLGVIASIFGAIAAFIMMVLGLVWYPVKVMLRKRREKKAGGAAVSQSAAASASETSSDRPGA